MAEGVSAPCVFVAPGLSLLFAFVVVPKAICVKANISPLATTYSSMS